MSNEINNAVSNEVTNNEVTTIELDQYETLKGLKFNVETFRALIDMVKAQSDRIAALESKNQTSSTKREMTIDDATKIMIGDLREKTHNECVLALGLSYGQVYSARLGHTFKPVTKQMIADGLANLWEKKAK